MAKTKEEICQINNTDVVIIAVVGLMREKKTLIVFVFFFLFFFLLLFVLKVSQGIRGRIENAIYLYHQI